MSLDLRGAAYLIVIGAVAAGAWWLYRSRDLFNPLSSENLAHRATSDVIATVTGGAAAGGEDTLGGVFARFREWISGDAAKIEALKRGSAPDPAQAEIATARANAYGQSTGGFFVG